MTFVRDNLPNWRDDPDRSQQSAENPLNSHLCSFLNSQARHHFQMVQFHHQQQEQNQNRYLDFAAQPTEGGLFSGNYYSIYKPIVVFEGKRLPAPASYRQYEYVTGLAEASGGIQRFKLGLHGAQCQVAVLIGYIQASTAAYWFAQINMWIRQLADRTLSDGQVWDAAEQLTDYVGDGTVSSATSNSSHSRTGSCISARIQLRHLWVEMHTAATG